MIRSTFIAGFPGETEEEFEHLLGFMREAQIDRAGCFAYSPVKGAAANDLPGMLPEGARVAHKTGTLSNTSSDVGIIHTPDGRAIAIAVYVTGQGGKPNRDYRIASISRAVYDG